MKAFYVILSVTLAYAEPPNTQYIPALKGFTSPSSQYEIPSVSPTYGTPTYISPSTYGAPTNAYGVPPVTYIPTKTYGIPLTTYRPVLPRQPIEYGGPKYLPPYGAEEPASYNFKYDVQAPEYGTEFGHEEARQGDVAQGRYYTLLPDGRRQIVEYVADAGGYRPRIRYEQVGYPQATGYHY